jgi:hypothetical protein
MKQMCPDILRALLVNYEVEEDNFLGQIMTSDESWVRHFELGTK